MRSLSGLTRPDLSDTGHGGVPGSELHLSLGHVVECLDSLLQHLLQVFRKQEPVYRNLHVVLNLFVVQILRGSPGEIMNVMSGPSQSSDYL